MSQIDISVRIHEFRSLRCNVRDIQHPVAEKLILNADVVLIRQGYSDSGIKKYGAQIGAGTGAVGSIGIAGEIAPAGGKIPAAGRGTDPAGVGIRRAIAQGNRVGGLSWYART